MTSRNPFIPFYFQPGETRRLPFAAWDMNGKVQPKVGDYCYQSGDSQQLTLVVIEVDTEAKAFVLQAAFAEILMADDIRSTPEYQGTMLAERERLGNAINQMTSAVLKEFEGTILHRLVKWWLKVGN